MELRIIDGDLLDQDVDVIVNAWNRNIIPWWLLLPQGTGGIPPDRALAIMHDEGQQFLSMAKSGSSDSNVPAD